jgi:hypothetical protein
VARLIQTESTLPERSLVGEQSPQLIRLLPEGFAMVVDGAAGLLGNVFENFRQWQLLAAR